ncbi:NADH:flavin oxidoreductase/NADH oxidase family protein [Ramlibacter sp. WS9]|uniref:NADH:flavin oxidoreductase/NADH oxidase family protein n=1 Tax=Ramlibacter sp. WS9 TaxID=1882741 RepID=UPI0011415CE4|nr:NADH:flavin oxidoreductase/NADH oxidase family protein [Ramlibacter sp. WS9]ROZ68748.1 NADH:flavin oxidoreductase/NADH oxidase family protein [Ramlibacter sp. WS9]
MNNLLSAPLQLPCGAVLKNRLAKAAMTEGLADPMNRVTPELLRLYKRWAGNGFGLMLTGNVQVDRHHMERSSNVAIDGNGGLEDLQRLAEIGRQDGAHFWVQLNHTGRQTAMDVNASPLAPSAISLPMAEAGCGQARAMTQEQVADVIRRFADAAAVCRETGFTGVQIHAAHGYLLSQFLSPLANARNDEWGGPLENRARLLLETVRAVRRAVGADFPVSVKLNSADFQRGGFDFEESMTVVSWLSEERIDLLEISGGNYEQPQMAGMGESADHQGKPVTASTRAREAYFLDYARQVKPRASVPLMITGGMRGVASMNEALSSQACQVVGIARPMCTHPDSLGKYLLNGDRQDLPSLERLLEIPRDALGPDIDDATFKRLESFGVLGWYCEQIERIGAGLEPALDLTVLEALQNFQQHKADKTRDWARP